MTHTITVGGSTFQLIGETNEMWSLKDDAGFVLAKIPRVLAKLEQLLDGGRFDNIFEIGIHRGGSTAYLTEYLKPRRIAAIDISEPAAVLDAWIAAEGRHDQVRPFYHVDQADAARLDAICAEVFGDERLDLVEDDASHVLDKTRASFNALFPRLREGGLYIIEDWAWAEWFRGVEYCLSPMLKQSGPLSDLIFDLVIASVTGRGLIEEVLINDGFVAVRRGAREVTGPFDIKDYR